jgi:DNA-binding LacI/PurR family transcriptional regulator
MSFRKSERIIRELRAQILSGQRKPGEKLPTYDELMEMFGVTRPTVARAVAAIRAQGLVTAHGTRGLFVADEFPHHQRYLWVTSEYPGHPEWTTFMATFLQLIERGETGLPGEVIALTGVDGRSNNPAYQQLCEMIQDESAAGLFVMNSATTYVLPILEQPNLPRVAIWAPLPHAGLITLAFDELIERACKSLLLGGRRYAVISPHQPNLEKSQACLYKLGLSADNLSCLRTTPVGCDALARLLMERPDRPDAVFVTDDNLVEPMLRGFAEAGVSPKKDVYVLAHCNWPCPVGAEAGVEHIGFDVREILAAGRECIEAQRAGDPQPERRVHPMFASELFESVDDDNG